MLQKILALDPGNSTGWVLRKDDGTLAGGTIDAYHANVWRLLNDCMPDIVVFETFQMYPGKAQKLIWNTFYPCEVIGVIKLWVQIHPYVSIIGLQPSVKKYALDSNELNLWKTVMCKQGEKPTEHTRDAVRLLRYFERNRC